MTQEKIGGIAEGLQHHDETMRFEDLAGLPEGVDDVGCLVAHGEFTVIVTRNDGDPFPMTAGGDVHGLVTRVQEFVEPRRVAGTQ